MPQRSLVKPTLFKRLAALYHIQQIGSVTSLMGSTMVQPRREGHLGAMYVTYMEPTQGKLESY